MTDAGADPILDALGALHRVIDRLRAPDGCPWDRAQTESTMAPHLIEEAHEAADAIARSDDREIAAELGDVLANVFLISDMGRARGAFDLSDVARSIHEKLVRRHPHVFPDQDGNVADKSDADGTIRQWEKLKQKERGAKGSALDGVPTSMPALLRAFRVGQKAARVGFDWPDHDGPRRKIDEELAELDEALAALPEDVSNDDPLRAAAQSELGDVLFSICNLARHHGIDPETALRGTVDKFSRRFRSVEGHFGEKLADASLEEMEAVWVSAKNDDVLGSNG